MQEKNIQDQIEKLAIEQEIHLAQRAHKHWIMFEDKNNKFF